MPVNEHDDKFAFFLSSYNERFIDNDHEEKENNETTNGNIGVDQQSTSTTPSPSPNIFIKESTIESTIDGKKVICIVVDKFNTTTGLQRYKIRPLYGTKINIVASKDLEHIDPEPADIPLTANDVDTRMMTHCLTSQELKQIWYGNVNSTVTDNERLTLYWYHRLQCAPLVTLHRLAHRGVLPKGISKVEKMPLCASWVFAMTHRRGCRTKAKK